MGGYPVPKPSFNLAAVVAETIGLAVQDESVSTIPKFLMESTFVASCLKTVFFSFALKFCKKCSKFQ